MGYDRSRPIPWSSLLKMSGLYMLIANVVFFLVARNQYTPSLFVATAVGALFYLAFSAVLAKFGYDPVSMRNRRMEATRARQAAKQQARAEKRAASGGKARKAKAGQVDATGRTRPQPTSRTNLGNRQPKVKR